MALRLLLDENVLHPGLWNAMQILSVQWQGFVIDAVRVGEAGAPGYGTKDPPLLQWAIMLGDTVHAPQYRGGRSWGSGLRWR
jgi:hypothetical protein